MKKIISKVVAVILVAVCIFSFAGCEGKDETKTVAICTPYVSSVTTKQMVDLMQSKLEAEGCEVSVMDSANDVSRFAQDIETSVTSGVDAIIIVSADPSLVGPQIAEAADAGIPIFGCDAGYVDDMQMNATSDNYEMGKTIAQYLFDKLGGEGNIIHLSHRPHPGVVLRTNALEDLLKTNSGINLMSEHHVDVPNQITNAKEIVENILTTYPEPGTIDAIICGWDEPAIGATQALQEAGRDEILVVGVDGNEQAVKLINDGTNMIATLSQDFEGMAEIVTKEVIKVFNGEETTKGNMFAEAILID